MTITPTLLNTLIGIATFGVVFALNSLVEWWIHGKMLHGEESSPAVVEHNEHHTGHAKVAYKSVRAGEEYGFGVEMSLKILLCMTILGFVVSYLLSKGVVLYTTTATTLFYCWAFGFVHQRLHEPKVEGWFERTSLYRRLDKNHHIHHGRGDRNFCIVSPIGDKMMWTFHRPERHRAARIDARL